MGDVKKILASCELNDREKHNSRLFVDLCENIHIHYREYRFVFSLPEFFEFCEVINGSEQDVRNYLINNPDYKEGKFPTTIMVAGGRERQLKFLEKSPSPNSSYYDNNSLIVELQEEYVTDEIHVHYRDFRIVLNRENFKELAIQFKNAYRELEEYEKHNDYIREKHVDREIESFNEEFGSKLFGNYIQGTAEVKLNEIKSYWYEDIRKEWVPDKEYSDYLKTRIKNEEPVLPIVLSKKEAGIHYIIDGHHRYYAALESGKEYIDAVITDITFKESEQIRKAEVMLKEFDKTTDNKYRLSDFFKNYVACSLNDYYKNSFRDIVKTKEQEIIPWIKRLLPFRFIKRFAFKLFYDKPQN